ncbi:MAG TPA: M20/M25/M40 family metallo-hydrolase [Chitinophagales bacterium]|nr:M20/M25/M40 family metallo-hydrolase [Chitinophagales bacterium]
MKKLLILLLIALVIFLGIIFYNFSQTKPQASTNTTIATDLSSIKGQNERISKSITFQTVSYEDTTLIDYDQFLAFHEFLKTSYPIVFEKLELEMVSNYSMVLKWKGNDPTLLPGIFMAHQDVVPVSDDTKDLWKNPPFEGLIIDGVLHGRGAIDDKINLMAQLESVQFLLENEFQPKRDIYLVFGHDEEIGGKQGAVKIAELMQSRGIKAEFVLDEGGFVTNDKVPGMTEAVALIGTSEKGYLNLDLSVNINGGHSSMPTPENAIAVLAKAITDLNSQPFSPRLTTSVKDFLNHIAPHSSFVNKLAMSNLWVFQPIVFNIYSKSGPGDAMIRTTMVPTIINGGNKANVIPNIVKATVNLRLLPGTSIQDAIQHVTKAVNNPLVNIEAQPGAMEASAVSPIDNEVFRNFKSKIETHFDNAIVAPFLMIGGTDSRHFNIVSENIYKFSPMIDPEGFHGVNEQLNLKDYNKTIGFYVDFLKEL